MKLLVDTTDYDKTIKLAHQLNCVHNCQYENVSPVTFHCFWHGKLDKKHLYSIMSCYFFNVLNNKHKIILWLENNVPNKFNVEIQKYAEIKNFFFNKEIFNTNFIKKPFYYKKNLSFYSDVVRYLLLYNYGGVWFDLDCFFLRPFDPLFFNYGNEICVYQWEEHNFPNGAIFISLEQKSDKLRQNIEFIIKNNKGWGFQEANLTYDLPLDMLVLPCSWFDGGWIKNSYDIYFEHFFKKTLGKYNFDNFFAGSFCFHWHNKWDAKIHRKSVCMRLVNIIKNKITYKNIKQQKLCI